MGISYVYKRLTPQDSAVVPFYAHKQYNYISSSAASNSITHFDARWTSESVSLYSSESTSADGLFDSIENIKYNQIDHVFYRDYIKAPVLRRDFIDAKKQRRDLYEKVNILSIPSGLYGSEIRKSSFFLSSSNNYEVVDDAYGNLIISGTVVGDYPTDVDRNVFRLDPIKGFKKYDLTVWEGYARFTAYYNTAAKLNISERSFW